MSLEARRPGAFPLDQFHDGNCRGRAQAHRDLGRSGPEDLSGPFGTRDWPVSLANLGTSERFWLNLQARYELEGDKDRLGNRLEKEVRVLAGAR